MKNYKRRIIAAAIASAAALPMVWGAAPAVAAPAQVESGIRVLVAEKSFTAGQVKVEGTVKVGNTLTAKVSNLTPSNTSGATYKYQWYRGSTKISGATSKTYKVAAADAGKQLYVTVTATKDGYAKRVLTSAKTDKVPPARGTRENPYNFGETANLEGVKVTPRTMELGRNPIVYVDLENTGAGYSYSKVKSSFMYSAGDTCWQGDSAPLSPGESRYGANFNSYSCGERQDQFRFLILQNYNGTESVFYRVP